jgi:hypothetical protein
MRGILPLDSCSPASLHAAREIQIIAKIKDDISNFMLRHVAWFIHRLNMELDLQSLFGLLWTAVLIG